MKRGQIQTQISLLDHLNLNFRGLKNNKPNVQGTKNIREKREDEINCLWKCTPLSLRNINKSKRYCILWFVGLLGDDHFKYTTLKLYYSVTEKWGKHSLNVVFVVC